MSTEHASAYEALAAIGLRVGPRNGDHLDRRQILDAKTGEVVHEAMLVSDAWALVHACEFCGEATDRSCYTCPAHTCEACIETADAVGDCPQCAEDDRRKAERRELERVKREGDGRW